MSNRSLCSPFTSLTNYEHIRLKIWSVRSLWVVTTRYTHEFLWSSLSISSSDSSEKTLYIQIDWIFRPLQLMALSFTDESIYNVRDKENLEIPTCYDLKYVSLANFYWKWFNSRFITNQIYGNRQKVNYFKLEQKDIFLKRFIFF